MTNPYESPQHGANETASDVPRLTLSRRFTAGMAFFMCFVWTALVVMIAVMSIAKDEFDDGLKGIAFSVPMAVLFFWIGCQFLKPPANQ